MLGEIDVKIGCAFEYITIDAAHIGITGIFNQLGFVENGIGKRRNITAAKGDATLVIFSSPLLAFVINIAKCLRLIFAAANGKGFITLTAIYIGINSGRNTISFLLCE